MNKLELFVHDLPSPESARRFFDQFSERNPTQVNRLQKKEGLFSDILTLASYSPLLATTLIQNPEYVTWLGRKRSDSSVRDKDELLESLARFALTNSQLEPNVLFARFRRRELLRIFLRDIRRLGTIAEITEEISNLADAILENALRLARQEMDNRYGAPFEVDEKGRQRPSDISVVSLGKLGSKELNYSSDIDLLFIYSADGSTTGTGSRGSVTNREYFVKLAETVTQLVGKQSGEGAAYRVDMRLRPHGRVGALALSQKETVKYYLQDARSWEQQVLIRSRASAGSAAIFKSFFTAVEKTVFKPGRDAGEALRGVYRSKEKIDHEHRADTLFDVKLGRGGIREIEFIAQALQLAHGGTDRWLRVPHTLISIARLADRHHLTADELSRLSNAYDFLRRLEHILQMEHGLQTHSLSADPEKLGLIAAKMRCADQAELEAAVASHTHNVHQTFLRVFGEDAEITADEPAFEPAAESNAVPPKESSRSNSAEHLELQVVTSIQKLADAPKLTSRQMSVLRRVSAVSPKFAEMIASIPRLASSLKVPSETIVATDHNAAFVAEVDFEADLPTVLGSMRTTWSRLLLEIAIADIYQVVPVSEIRLLQTKLAEASIETAMRAATRPLGGLDAAPTVLALGKLGSGTLDYDSDLDVILVYEEGSNAVVTAEVYSRVVEQFVTLLSGMTRDGNLYRVDLRLRPHGKNGPTVTTAGALIDYIEQDASIWELLAYVQMRAVGGGSAAIETVAREAIKRRASCEDVETLKSESRKMRLRLEESHGRTPGGREINIKFGSGGLLDIYFAVRFLQLANGDAIAPEVRSTSAKLAAFHAAGLLSADDFASLHAGHAFLSALDHTIRLIVGRSSRFPRANHTAVEHIAERMSLRSVDELYQQLALNRINVRSAFDNVLEK